MLALPRLLSIPRQQACARWLALLALLLAAMPAIAAPRPEPEVAAKAAQAQAAALQAENAALRERAEVEKRLATLEGKATAEDRARDNLTKSITILGFIITIIGLAAGFASYVVAGARAANEARDLTEKALKKVRDDFDDESNKRLADFDQRIGKLRTLAEEIGTLAATVKDRAAETDTHMPTIRAGAKAAEDLIAGSSNRVPDTTVASLAQKKAMLAAVTESSRQAEEDWTVDQFKAAIGKALYDDKEWSRGVELAQRLIDRHGEDRDARRFGLRSLGRAGINGQLWQQALGAYIALVSDYEAAGESETVPCCSAKHQQGYVLNALGQHSQAETLYRKLLPLRERIEGTKASGTLGTRHEFARAVLNQGRAREAEVMLRELLPIWERVDGAEAWGTLATRQVLARAVLDQGRTAEAEFLFRELLSLCERLDGVVDSRKYVIRYCWAEALVRSSKAADARDALSVIPDQVLNADWSLRWEVELAFVRARVADALGERAAATAHLHRAREIYAEIYPPDHFRRRELEDYIANRPPHQGDPA